MTAVEGALPTGAKKAFYTQLKADLAAEQTAFGSPAPNRTAIAWAHDKYSDANAMVTHGADQMSKFDLRYYAPGCFSEVTIDVATLHDLSGMYNAFLTYTGLTVNHTLLSTGQLDAETDNIAAGTVTYDAVEMLRYMATPDVLAQGNVVSAMTPVSALQPVMAAVYSDKFGNMDMDPLVLAYRPSMYANSIYATEFATFEGGSGQVWQPPATLTALWQQHRYLISKGRNGLPLKIAASEWETEFYVAIAANYVPNDSTVLQTSSQAAYIDAANDILMYYGASAFDPDPANTNWGAVNASDDFSIWWLDRGKFGDGTDWQFMELPPKDSSTAKKTYTSFDGWGIGSFAKAGQTDAQKAAANAFVAHMASKSGIDTDHVSTRMFQTPLTHQMSVANTVAETSESSEFIASFFDVLNTVGAKTDPLRLPLGHNDWVTRGSTLAAQLQSFPTSGTLDLSVLP